MLVNPRLKLALDFLKISFSFEPEGAFITYEDNDCKIEAYSQEIVRIPSLLEESEKSISIDQLSKITEFLTGIRLTLGRDEPSLYNSDHRKIIYLRLCLPSNILQLEFQDGEETLNYDDYISELLRSRWSLIDVN